MRFLSLIRRMGCQLDSLSSAPVGDKGSQIAEFAISAPLLVVLTVGIFDFSGAFTLKEKVMSAAQQGSALAANQTTLDLSNPNPDSVAAVRDAVFNYLANEKVLARANQGSCVPGSAPAQTGLKWTYTINGCGNITTDNLIITIDRGYVFTSGTENIASSHVSVSYPYHWEFDRVIGLVAPGANYAPTTQITAEAIAQNQS